MVESKAEGVGGVNTPLGWATTVATFHLLVRTRCFMDYLKSNPKR